MRVKAVLWVFCALIYAMAILFAAALTVFYVGLTEEVLSEGVLYAEVALSFCAVALMVLILVFSIAEKFSEDKSPCACTLKVKIALIPFYILTGYSCGLLLSDKIAVALLVIIMVIFVIYTIVAAYLFLVFSGMANIVYLIKSVAKQRRTEFVAYIVLHFIPIADIVAAALVYRIKKREQSGLKVWPKDV